MNPWPVCWLVPQLGPSPRCGGDQQSARVGQVSMIPDLSDFVRVENPSTLKGPAWPPPRTPFCHCCSKSLSTWKVAVVPIPWDENHRKARTPGNSFDALT